MVTVQFLRRAREPGAQLEFILGVEPHQHGLIVPLHFVGRLAAEAAKQRVTRLALAPAEIELRFALRHADQPHQLHLLVALYGAIQELVFPVRPSRDVQHPERPLSSVHREHPGIIRQRRLRCARRRSGSGGRGRLVGRRDTELVERHTRLIRLYPETEGQRIAVRAAGTLLLLHHASGPVRQPCYDRATAITSRRHIGLHRHRRVLE